MARIARPTKIKILNGEPNKDRINRQEPEPKKLKTSCPAALVGPARMEWKRVYPILEGMGVMTAADRAILAIYCIAWGTLVDVQKKINQRQEEAAKEGKSPAGAYLSISSQGINVYPLLAVRSKTMEQINQFGAKLGLSPADRGRINVPEALKEDEFEELLSRNRDN